MFKEFLLKDILDFPPTNFKNPTKMEGYIEGDIPVYGSSKNDLPIAFTSKNKKLKFYKDCLSYNRNGSVGYVFYRTGLFTTTEDHRPLILKKEFEKQIDYLFLKYKIQNAIRSLSYSWSEKAGKQKLSNISIKIPITEFEEFDLKKQKKIAEKYNKIESYKKEITNFKNELSYTEVEQNIEILGNYREILVSDIFEIKKGDSKHTKKSIRENLGEYPLYSSQTTKEGIIGGISTYDYDCACLTWTSDGIHAGTVFLRNGKFSMTTHCGALIPKENAHLYLPFLKFALNSILKQYAVGDLNKRVTVSIMKTVTVRIPINEYNEFDISKQKALAELYQEQLVKNEKIKQLKDKVIENIKSIIDAEVDIL